MTWTRPPPELPPRSPTSTEGPALPPNQPDLLRQISAQAATPQANSEGTFLSSKDQPLLQN